MAEELFPLEIKIEATRQQFPHAPKEQLGKWTIRRWTWYEKQTAFDSASEVIDAKKGLLKTTPANIYLQMLLVSIRETPENWEKTEENVKNLDPDLGTALLNAARQVNGLTEKEKEVFLGLSENEKDTPS